MTFSISGNTTVDTIRHKEAQKKLWAAAVHEAAHSVCAIAYCGCEFDTVTIREDGSGLVSGMKSGKYKTDAQKIADDVVICLAGQMGQEIEEGKNLPVQSHPDYTHVLNKFLALGYTGPQAQGEIFSWQQKTKSILMQHWPRVQRVALRLMEKRELTYREILYL